MERKKAESRSLSLHAVSSLQRIVSYMRSYLVFSIREYSKDGYNNSGFKLDYSNALIL